MVPTIRYAPIASASPFATPHAAFLPRERRSGELPAVMIKMPLTRIEMGSATNTPIVRKN
jgi:hypothetical protein